LYLAPTAQQIHRLVWGSAPGLMDKNTSAEGAIHCGRISLHYWRVAYFNERLQCGYV
jgi:hypothetical protein